MAAEFDSLADRADRTPSSSDMLTKLRPVVASARRNARSLGSSMTSDWSTDDGLTAWVWCSQIEAVLTELTGLGNAVTSTDGPLLLAPLLEHVAELAGERSFRRLSWLLDLADAVQLKGAAREKAVCEVYELLNDTVVPAGFDMDHLHRAQSNAQSKTADSHAVCIVHCALPLREVCHPDPCFLQARYLTMRTTFALLFCHAFLLSLAHRVAPR